MRNRAAVAALGMAAVLTILACGSDSTGPDNGAPNVPVIGNGPNAFGFAVLADGLTLDRTYQLSFTSDSSSIGLAVSGYGGGAGTFELFDEAHALLFARPLNGNIAEGQADVRVGRPAEVRLRFTGYTGSVAIGVNGD